MSIYSKIIKRKFSKKYSFAVVGSGPGCFHTIKHILNKYGENVRIDIFEKDPLPYGLVRSGIAPDHYTMKYVIKDYKEILRKQNVNIYCNVEILEKIENCNNDSTKILKFKSQQSYLGINTLINSYSAILLCCGAESEIRLNLPCFINEGNEKKYLGLSNDLKIENYYSGKEIVSWYNGLFESSETSSLNLINFHEIKDVVLIGNGNVSVDISRILLKDIKDLKNLDIPDHVLNKLKERKIERIHMVARRGVIQSAFSTKEIKELNKIKSMLIDIDELNKSKNIASLEELDSKDFATKRNLTNKFQFIDQLEKININNKYLEDLKNIFLRYLLEPSQLYVVKDNKTDILKVKEVGFVRNKLVGKPHAQKSEIDENLKNEQINIKCDFLISSVGYVSNKPFKSLFKYNGNVIENDKGFVKDNIFCAGWFKRGAKGILNETLVDARETYASIEKNIGNLRENPSEINIFDFIMNKNYIINKEKCLSLMEKEELDGKLEGKLLKKFISRKEIFSSNI